MSSGVVYPNVQETIRYVINGVDLESVAVILGDDEGLITPPEQPDVTVKVPGRHGVIDVGGTVGPGFITFSGYILGVDPTTGQWNVAEPFPEYLRRVDALQRLFTAPRLDITAIRPDGTSRRAYGRLMGSLQPAQQRANPWFGRFKVTVRIAAAFWEDSAAVTQNIDGVTGTTVPLTAFQAATAPLSELTITVPGPCNNPLWIHGDRTLQWNGVIPAGRQLVINTANWTVSSGTGAAWTPDLRQVSFGPGPSWFELDPQRDPFELTWIHTGGGNTRSWITARRKYQNA